MSFAGGPHTLMSRDEGTDRQVCRLPIKVSVQLQFPASGPFDSASANDE